MKSRRAKRRHMQRTRSEEKRRRASRQARMARTVQPVQPDIQSLLGWALPGHYPPSASLLTKPQTGPADSLPHSMGASVRLSFAPEDRVRAQAGKQLHDAERRLRQNEEGNPKIEDAPLCAMSWSPILSALDGFYCAKCDGFFSHDVRDWVGVQCNDGFLFKFCLGHLIDELDMAELWKTTAHWFFGHPTVSPCEFVLRPPQEEQGMFRRLCSKQQVPSRDVQRRRIAEELKRRSSSSAHRVLAQHGGYFAPQARPFDVPRMPAGRCALNALRVSQRRPGLACAIGLAVSGSGEVTTHVWCLDAGGRVVDPTWTRCEHLEYFGVPVRAGLLRRFLKRGNPWLKLELFGEAELLNNIITVPGHGESPSREEVMRNADNTRA